MKLRYIILFFILISGHFIKAQDYSVDKEIKEIDSLIQYNKFDIAQKKSDSLYNQINKLSSNKKYKSQSLEVRFRQALILDRQDKPSAEVLRILLEIIDQVKKERLYTLSYKIHLLVALSYEKAENLELTDKYLDIAYEMLEEHKIENHYSTYYIRRSSYYRQIGEMDSSFYYVEKAKEYAEKYKNETDLVDSYILLGFFASYNKNYKEALKYSFLLKYYREKFNDTVSLAMSFNNISRLYLKTGESHKALLYNDSSRKFFTFKSTVLYDYFFSQTRSEIFEAIGNKDSALYYYKQYHEKWAFEKEQDEKIKTKELEEKFQNDKKEAVIRSKNQQLISIIGILSVIVIASILIIRKNKKINSQNKVINKQLEELTKTLEQKQMLLSELQHRVKNNLQHVISILEIQKESVDFNNIDELIRENKNRIHSMALLHKKLSVSENMKEIDLNQYLIELSELVRDSYYKKNRKIQLNVKCEVETMSIEKALPVGLIITELVSNSMKHAFKKLNIGFISVEITKDKNINKLYYSDNGIGFDFNETREKGLGLEIIKGLIEQLDGTVESRNDNGFELIMYF